MFELGIMKKDEIKINGLYKIEEKDLKRCASVAAHAFLDDNSSKFLLSSKLTLKTLCEYYRVIFNATYKKMHMYAESKNLNGFIIVAPIENTELTTWDFIKAGGLKLLLRCGIGTLCRSFAYEQNCIRIRKKIISTNSWYVFQFGVNPKKQGTGLGSKLMKSVLELLDDKKVSCYLETHKMINVKMYEHFGFLVKSIDKLPNKTMQQFAMLRN